MTTHFHGSPIWGDKGRIARIAHRGSGAFVSYARTDQIKLCFEEADTVCIDNGAFSVWKSGKSIEWDDFYCKFLPKWYDNPKLRFFVIPDSIEGSEEDNDKLITKVPSDMIGKASPVWHMHESIDRFIRLSSEWDWVCIGSSGEFASVRSVPWKKRIEMAFDAYYENGCTAKLHGLRMLDGRVFGNYPLNSADSTKMACNVPKYHVVAPDVTIEAARMHTHPSKWVNTTDIEIAIRQCISGGGSMGDILAMRCAILKTCVESVKPPTMEEWYRKRNPLGFLFG